MKKKFSLSRSMVQVLLIFWLVVQLYPLLFMFICAFRESGQIIIDPFGLPNSVYLQNFIEAWKGNSITSEFTLQHFFMNSLFVTVCSLVGLCFVSLFAGYALCRFRFPGHKFIYTMIVCMLTVPMQALCVSIFTMIKDLGGLNKLTSLVPLYIACNIPMSIIIMKTNFEAIPLAIEEAALLDGCNKFQTFWHVALPMSRGSIATIAIVNLTSIWSEFMFASMIEMMPKSRTLPVAVSLFNSSMYNNTMGPLMAALAISSLPLIVAYFVFQKQITKGMALGAVK